MKNKLAFVAAGVLAASFALPMQASAELEELQVHGQIRIRGNHLDPGLGGNAGPPATGGFDDDASGDDFYNALAEVNFTADMSDDVTGFIALRSYDIYGVNIPGVDNDPDDGDFEPNGYAGFTNTSAFASLAGGGNDTVGLYQAYIQADNVGGYPISVKIGRQEIALGREFLIGNNDDGVFFSGQALDALRVTYDNDESLMVTAFTAKILEFRNAEQDADVDIHAVYATYYGLEMMDIDAYWIWVDNGVGEPLLGFGNPIGDTSENLHTLGARVYGTAMDDRLEYNAEIAYQVGDSNVGGPVSFAAPVFPFDSLDVEAWAFNILVGYTFDDVQYTPEVHFEWALFTGDESSTDGDWEQFTRLTSDVHYGKINLGGAFDALTTNMSIIRIGASAQATDTVSVYGDLLFFTLDEDGAIPSTSDVVFGIPQATSPFNASPGSSDDEVGTELDLWTEWQYSEDLTLSAGWSHFFTGDAVENAFGGDDDLDYVWWEAQLVF